MGNFEGKMPKELKRAHYHRWGLKNQDPNFTPTRPRGLSWFKKLLHANSKTTVSGQKFYGLLDTIKMLGHEKLDVIDIFKIDCEFDRDWFPLRTITTWSKFGLLCGILWSDINILKRFLHICLGEGCEWETYTDWLAKGVPTLHQIQVEVHKVPGEVALNFFDTLEAAGYLRYHKEANIQFGSSCIEYGMVKVRLSTTVIIGFNSSCLLVSITSMYCSRCLRISWMGRILLSTKWNTPWLTVILQSKLKGMFWWVKMNSSCVMLRMKCFILRMKASNMMNAHETEMTKDYFTFQAEINIRVIATIYIAQFMVTSTWSLQSSSACMICRLSKLFDLSVSIGFKALHALHHTAAYNPRLIATDCTKNWPWDTQMTAPWKFWMQSANVATLSYLAFPPFMFLVQSNKLYVIWCVGLSSGQYQP